MSLRKWVRERRHVTPVTEPDAAADPVLLELEQLIANGGGTLRATVDPPQRVGVRQAEQMIQATQVLYGELLRRAGAAGFDVTTTFTPTGWAMTLRSKDAR